MRSAGNDRNHQLPAPWGARVRHGPATCRRRPSPAAHTAASGCQHPQLRHSQRVDAAAHLTHDGRIATSWWRWRAGLEGILNSNRIVAGTAATIACSRNDVIAVVFIRGYRYKKGRIHT